MQLPLSWLKEWLPVELSVDELSHHLTMLGLEVEGIEYSGVTFHGVYVAEVLSCSPHPKADKLQLVTITMGGDPISLVCGGANCRKGLKVAYAALGATLNDGKGGTFSIEPRAVRGEMSHGMLCGHDELDLPLKPYGVEGGIMELDNNFKLGAPLASYYGEPILEVSLTPNLVYCNSIRGIAKELGISLKKALIPHPYTLKEENSSSLSLSVMASKECPRFCIREIKGVQVGPSPDWLVKKLETAGVRSINNIVDATNYILKEWGQPLHAYDASSFPDGKICVRKAQKGELLQLLDKNEVILLEDHLVIASSKKVEALAGVMGGASSEVHEKSDDILLEAAYFDPTTVRKSAKHFGLSTDASYNFERGCDPDIVLEALDRCTALILEIAGGRCTEKVEFYPEPLLPCPIELRAERVNSILGTHLSVSEVEAYLISMELKLQKKDETTFIVIPPAGRHDLKREIDLVEEIARFYGFENLQNELTPALYQTTEMEDAPLYSFENELRSLLLAEGLDEWLTCDLVGQKENDLLHHKQGEVVAVLNPRSQEQSILRTSLLPNFLQVVRHNFDHQKFNLRSFEIGRIHFKTKQGYQEPSVLSLLCTGSQSPHTWQHSDVPTDFYTLKGVIERLFGQLNLSYEIKASSHPNFHPGQQATLWHENQELGTFGALHPKTTQVYGIEHPIFFAELAIEPLLALKKGEKLFSAPPQFPSSTRDWTVTLPQHFPSGQLLSDPVLQKETLLERILLIDVYQHEKLGSDVKNVTYRFVYRDTNRTLSLKEVEEAHERVVAQANTMIKTSENAL
jgi:phenylalanyl-tRNA synthetase beta chain